MRYSFVLLMLFASLLSCGTKEEKLEKSENNKVFVTYQLSPMASLMERMYAESVLLKEHVIQEEEGVELSTDFLKELPFAALTTATDRDAFFEVQMQEFIDAYALLDSQSIIQKDSYNAMVQSCLSCHQVKCTGPIERIKKLIIK